MKIAIPNFNINIGSERIPFYVYKKLIEKYFQVEFINFSSIDKSDVVFLHGSKDNSNILKKKRKRTKYILFKPHREISISCSGKNLLKRIISYIIFFIKNKFSKEYQNNKYNLEKADLLVCDTPRISRFFSAKGYNTVYCSLIDDFDESIIRYRNKNQNRNINDINILYTGNLSHYNSNISQLIEVLFEIKTNNKLNINLECLSGRLEKENCFRRNNINLNIHFHKYSKDNLKKLLRKCDIGWVPNNYSISTILNNDFLKILLTTITQKFDIIRCEKFSSNAGRSIIFAQYGIPFITNPNEESSILFEPITDFIYYESKQQLKVKLQQLISLKNRNFISEKIFDNYNYQKHSFEQVKKLFDAINNL